MTTPTTEPRRRVGDQNLLGRVRGWWRRWGLLITGVWLIVVSAAVLWVSLAFYESQEATENAARASCERSRTFGPALADAYERYQILEPSELAAYRSTLPESCPD